MGEKVETEIAYSSAWVDVKNRKSPVVNFWEKLV